MPKRNIKLTSDTPKYTSKALAEKVNEEKISFSFLFFCQEKYFGLGGQNNTSWFISVLDRLKSLGDYTKSQILENQKLRASLRIHDIDFNDAGVSITRESITSVPKQFISNNADYPFYQISVSTSRGRIIGFFVESVFYVVYLDRFHNMYPAKYGITPTTVEVTDYDALLSKLRTIVKEMSSCGNQQCRIPSIIENIPGLEKNIVYIAVNDSDFEELMKMKQTNTWEDILLCGMYQKI